jgi:hypothetical protein
MAGARDGDVAEAGVEQVSGWTPVSRCQNALGGEALGTVTGDGVTVVEVVMFLRVALDLAVAIETG